MGTVLSITVVVLGAVACFLSGAIYGINKAMEIVEEEFGEAWTEDSRVAILTEEEAKA